MTTDPYQQFTQDMRVRALAALNTMRTALIAAGIAANRCTVTEEDTTNLRFRLDATRGARTLVTYFELTPVGVINGQMALIVTLYVEGNGAEITHSYTVGAPLSYIDGLAALADKLTAAEQTIGEVTVKARAFLQV